MELNKKNQIHEFKKLANKLQTILEQFADNPDGLSKTEREEIMEDYDTMTVHGSISLERLQE